jgi:hypothetical protein
MEKEGTQRTLEYSLSHDASAEIRQAVRDAALKTFKELSIDAVVSEALPDGVERESAPVYQRGNEAGYRTEEAALPVNYEAAEYKAGQEERDDVPKYSFTLTPSGAMWEAPAEAYEKQLDQKAFSEIMRTHHQEVYSSAELASRVEMYKLSLGFAARFLLYTFKTAGV